MGVKPILFISLDDKSPLVVHHKLSAFADIDLQMKNGFLVT